MVLIVGLIVVLGAGTRGGGGESGLPADYPRSVLQRVIWG
jgi:hypothetical protein